MQTAKLFTYYFIWYMNIFPYSQYIRNISAYYSVHDLGLSLSKTENFVMKIK